MKTEHIILSASSKLLISFFHTRCKQKTLSSLPPALAQKSKHVKTIPICLSYQMKTANTILSVSGLNPQSQHVQTIPIHLLYWMKTAKGIISTSGPSPQSQHVQAAHISLLENLLFFLYQKQCFGAEACWLCTIPMCVKMLLSHFCSFLKYLSTTSYLNT